MISFSLPHSTHISAEQRRIGLIMSIFRQTEDMWSEGVCNRISKASQYWLQHISYSRGHCSIRLFCNICDGFAVEFITWRQGRLWIRRDLMKGLVNSITLYLICGIIWMCHHYWNENRSCLWRGGVRSDQDQCMKVPRIIRESHPRIIRESFPDKLSSC